MEIQNLDNNLYLKTSLELESLLHNHFQHRQQSKKALKERLHEAELEIIHLRQNFSAFSEELKEERLRYGALKKSMEESEKRHCKALLEGNKVIHEKKCDLDTQARLLAVKAEECEFRLQSLQRQEAELLQRQEHLQISQSSFEASIIPAQKHAETERLRMQHAREQAEEYLEEAKISVLAAKRRKDDLESLYNIEMGCFDLEKEEAAKRLHIMRQEVYAITYIVSSRFLHVSVAETKAAERIRLNEREFLSRKDVLELKEKEFNSRIQREQKRINDEKEQINSIRDNMRREYKVILENIRLLGNYSSLEAEQSQVTNLKDLENLLSSLLE